MATTNPNYKNRKTPGVYITELDAFPTSIVGVDTAVPGFVGYTQQAVVAGKSVLMQPVAISSMADFEEVFGTEHNTIYNIDPIGTSTPSSTNADFTVDGTGYTLDVAEPQPRFNLYFSMRLFYANGGSTCYVVSVGDYSSAVAAQPLLDGLKAMSYQVGPTMLVIPDAVLLPPTVPAAGPGEPESADFEAVTQAMLTQCETLQDRVAILDVYNATQVTQSNVDLTLDNCITSFQACIPTQPVPPNYGMAYFPFLNTSIVKASDINYTNFNLSQTPTGTADPDPTTPASSPPAQYNQLQYILTLFNQEQYPNTVQNGKTVYNATQQKVQYYIDSIPYDPDPVPNHSSPDVLTLNNLLSSALPAYANMLAIVASKEGLLPPSGGMAGIFTLNDRTRGVWNAPANMPMASTVSLTVNLNDAQQGDLNVPVNGKAIDVIRYFQGQGPVVWGARTLDGNSQDWRYIQVRRTIVYIETSIKNAMNQFVFAANDASTWVAVKQMVSGFLTGLWSQGGLMGDKASDAFTVLCGVPETMTGTDILNGYMVVQVTVQMIHPAEFIELTFKQTMQGA